MRRMSHQKFQTWKLSSLSRLDYPHLLKSSQRNVLMHLLHLIRPFSFRCVGENLMKPKQTCHKLGFGEDGILHIEHISYFELLVASLAFFVPRCWVERHLEAMTSSPEDIWENEQTLCVCDFLSTQELRSKECIRTSLNPFYVQLSGKSIACSHHLECSGKPAMLEVLGLHHCWLYHRDSLAKSRCTLNRSCQFHVWNLGTCRSYSESSKPLIYCIWCFDLRRCEYRVVALIDKNTFSD